MTPESVNRRDAARTNESIIHQHTVFHRRTIDAWIYDTAMHKVMTVESREAGWQLQRSGVLFSFGCKLELLSALRFQLAWLQSMSRISDSSGDVGLCLPRLFCWLCDQAPCCHPITWQSGLNSPPKTQRHTNPGMGRRGEPFWTKTNHITCSHISMPLSLLWIASCPSGMKTGSVTPVWLHPSSSYFTPLTTLPSTSVSRAVVVLGFRVIFLR